ncbi:uncharacterized protein BDZ83DRAFT_728066 [Colletotrichum acutatum]|uniref:Uncharacterized protein n=1 Tax=Glomerella acutata TaxID=27357 RepID=A0AAD8UWP7_GLOAC|nr:uncharacterized protein BDZ83DRAFT_728066 [Colletotrichum acutatum]KAK1728469.1 hypothetical protein BDZ83DRAFT_728066 [Colletotrichum acutatum]
MQHTYMPFHAPNRQTEQRRSFHGAPTACANVDGGGRDKKYASSLVCAGRLLSRVAGLEPRLSTKGDQPAPSDVMSPPAGRLGSAKKEPEELAKSGLAAGFTKVPYSTASKVAVRLTARVSLALTVRQTAVVHYATTYLDCGSWLRILRALGFGEDEMVQMSNHFPATRRSGIATLLKDI